MTNQNPQWVSLPLAQHAASAGVVGDHADQPFGQNIGQAVTSSHRGTMTVALPSRGEICQPLLKHVQQNGEDRSVGSLSTHSWTLWQHPTHPTVPPTQPVYKNKHAAVSIILASSDVLWREKVFASWSTNMQSIHICSKVLQKTNQIWKYATFM